MKIILAIDRLDYPSAAKALLPLLGNAKKDGSLSFLLMAALGKLPAEQVSLLLSALPQQELDGIAVQLLAEKEEKLLELCSRFLENHALPLSVSALSLSKSMELSVVLTHIDYAALARRFLPMLPTAVLKDSPLSMLAGLPAKLLYTALEKLPQSRLEQAAVYLINKFSFQLIDKIEALAEDKGLGISLLSLSAEI